MKKYRLFSAVLTVLSPAAALAQSADPTAFALDLNRRLADGGNVMTSGYSARQALGLAYLGAAGETRAQMAAALRAGPDFADAERVLRRELLAPGEAVLKIANAIFIEKQYAVRPAWEKSVKESLGAAVFRREFGPAAVDEINAWAAENTAGRIPKIINKLGANDRAVLLNAVYFKGKWVHAFPKTAGGKRGGPRGGPMPVSFKLDGGKSYEASLMSVNEKFDYAENSAWQAVRLPYKGGRLAMIVVLPAEASSLAELRKTDSAAWGAMRAALRPRPGLVAMPKFKFTGSYDLIPPTKAMGMVLAYDRMKSDFSGISKPKDKREELYISKVLQKTFVEVDEEGTEAAAVTMGVAAARGASMREDPPFSFVADRPFLFAIEDVDHGAILFLGEVHDPRK